MSSNNSQPEVVSRPKKQAKTAKEDSSLPMRCSPLAERPHVVKLVAQSRFLTTEELGRLALCTSKDITMAVCERNSIDDIFYCLLINRLGLDQAQELLSSTKMSAEQCFRYFDSPMSENDEEVFQLQRLKYKLDDYQIVVVIRDHINEGPRLCKTLSRNEIRQFLRTGTIELDLLKTIKWSFSTRENGSWARVDFQATVRIICRGRKVDVGQRTYRGFAANADCGEWDHKYTIGCSMGSTSSYARSFIDHFSYSIHDEPDDWEKPREGYNRMRVIAYPYFDTEVYLNDRPKAVELTGFSLSVEILCSCDNGLEEDMRKVLRSPECQEHKIKFAHFLETVDGLASES